MSINTGNGDYLGCPFLSSQWQGQWVHVAAVFYNCDAEHPLTADNVRLYVNGQRQELTQFGTPLVRSATQIASFGSRLDLQYCFHGILDDVRVYNHELTAKEVGDIYDSTLRRTYAYDAAGNLTEKIDRDNRVTTYTYNAVNEQVQEDWLDGDGQSIHTTKTYYDAAGQVVGISDPDANYQYSYDALGRIIQARMAPGDLTQPAMGDSVGAIDPGDPSSRYDWDGDGHDEQYYCSVNWMLTPGQTYLFYASAAAFDPTVIVCKSDWTGMVAASRNAGNGDAWLQFTVPQDGTSWYVLVSSQVDVASTSSFALQSLVDPNPFVPNALVQFDYTYDAAGNLLSAAEDAAASLAAGLGSVTIDAYDALDRLQQIRQTTSDGATVNKRADYAYNADGSLNTVTRNANDTNNGTARVAQSAYAYDSLGRLTGLTHTPSGSGSTPIEYGWTYDAASRMVTMTNSAYPDEDITDLGYDATDQLLSANRSGAIYDEDYVYDDNGNRLTANGDDYSTGTANQLLFDGTYYYLYDNEGNRTLRFVDVDQSGTLTTADTEITEYDWDYRNRLTKVSSFADYRQLSIRCKRQRGRIHL